MLYQKNNSPMLDDALFQNPTSEYRGTPFWAWNCKLDERLVTTQIEYLKEMGFGGFHMHSRTGMATPYLSDEFMSLVKACIDKAEKEDMLAWLYDEDRWPSGAAGGLVTADPKYRARKLVFSPFERTDCVPKETSLATGEPYFVACYDVFLNENGELLRYERLNAAIAPPEKTGSNRWYAYCMTNEPSPWYNNQTYVDTLSNEAIDKFIAVTYEAYKNTAGDKFGGIVPAIFTDEPQFEKKHTLGFAAEQKDIVLPWTQDITATFEAAYGFDLLDFLPELFWELTGCKVSRARYLYHDHVAERFASAFADRCGQWCEANNLMLTGHMMEEPTLESQTAALGEAMRSYRSFQLPGIDMLCDFIELTTAKQAQSACHQYGREGVLSELYGVTNWDFDFRGHKFQGDWQAALGVTVRVPHLSWVSMAGEAKRDYPASINYQSPWYKEYTYVENHFARINTALTRGKPIVGIGVIHPVESYWLHWGPKESTDAIRRQLDRNFENITEWLLCGQADFDYISESLLPDLCPAASNPLQVGEMQYKAIIVPGCETLRRSTLDRLTQFKESGGRLIFIGACPRYVDAILSDEPEKLYRISETLPFERHAILSALSTEKLLDIRNSNGTEADNLLYNMRQDERCKWLFIAHAVKTAHADAVSPQKILIKIMGEYTPVLYNTLNGEITAMDYRLEAGNTLIDTTLYCHDSLLLRLDGKSGACVAATEPRKPQTEFDYKHKVRYTRSEPNVLLLDTAQYAFDNDEFHEAEDLLRADNLFRAALGFPSREDLVAQPWVLDQETISHHMTLKFMINSEIELENPVLAIEDAERLSITLNGNPVAPVVTGYYVDEAIKSIALPSLRRGENCLTVQIPFGKSTNVEYCYLLGDFNVKLEGCEKTIIPPTDMIGFGSITHQGMPFYGGNITYTVDFETQSGCDIGIRANNYRGALVKAAVDGVAAGVIAYAPYRLIAENVPPGKHSLSFTLFGNRYNTFGALHNANTANIWHGPNAWRTLDDEWCYEYKIRDMGIMASPVIEVFA